MTATVRAASIGVLAASCAGPGACPPTDAVTFDLADLAEVVPETDGSLTVGISTGLEPEATVHLVVRPGEGEPIADLDLTVGPDGTATHTLPVAAGAHVLVAWHDAGPDCPLPEARRTVFVLDPDAPCGVALATAPRDEPGWPDHGVVGAEHDVDPVTPGVQARVTLTAPPGWQAVLTAAPAVGTPLRLAERTIPADGAVTVVADLPDGPHELALTCTSPKEALVRAATPLALAADAEAPGCALSEPARGVRLDSTFDADGDPANGTQVGVRAVVDGPDVAGEPVRFLLDGAVAATVPAGADGSAEARVTLSAQGTHTLGVEARDHAGNTCAVTQDHFYDASVVPPTVRLVLLDGALTCGGDVTLDADADAAPGVQIGVFVDAPTATVRAVELSQGGTPTQVFADSGGAALLTLPAGTTTLVAVGVDSVGTRGQSPPCDLTLTP